MRVSFASAAYTAGGQGPDHPVSSGGLAGFFNESFVYTRELTSDGHAILEFQVEINGITVNGVDMLTWDYSGQIIDFKVMVRPLKAVRLIHENMGKMLAAQQHKNPSS